MKKPKRIQMSRKKGHSIAGIAINVARPTKWGNPFNWTDVEDIYTDTERRKMAVTDFEEWLEGKFSDILIGKRSQILEDLPELEGKNLACWCPLDQPCHADVLLALANKATPNNPNAGEPESLVDRSGNVASGTNQNSE